MERRSAISAQSTSLHICDWR